MNRTMLNAMLAQYARKTVTGTGGVSWLDGIHCEIPRIVVRGAATQKRYAGINLLDGELRVSPLTANGMTIQYLPDEDCYLLNGTATRGGRVSILEHADFGLKANQRYRIKYERVSGSIDASSSPGYNVFYLGYFVDSEIFNLLDSRSFSLADKGEVSKVSTVDGIAGTWFYFSSGVIMDNCKVRIMVYTGDEVLPYEPYTGGVPAPNPSYPILPQFAGAVTLTDAAGGAVTIPELLAIPDTTVCDTAEYLGGESWRITRRVGVIESYAGEAVGDVWCSSTGELSEGAAVWYELETPTVDTLTLGRLVQPKGAGSIEQTTGDLKCEIEVEYAGHS